MAVCGSVEDRHGIVLAKNELAKAYGIKTAETVVSALKKCPNLAICAPHYDEYLKYSKAANRIYERYTDLVESFGIDESWLDVTASSVFGTGEEIAEKIRHEIKAELGITDSIGVSFNKVFAKLGSDYKKPDAVTVISRNNFKNIVYPLPVCDLLFVGKQTEAALRKLGIMTIGALAEANPELLKIKLGKSGELLSVYDRGLDSDPVLPDRSDDVKSISNGYTFKKDLLGREECKNGIDFLCEEIGNKLRRKGLMCSTVQVSIKDQFLKLIQRQAPLEHPTDTGAEISKKAFEILCNTWNMEVPVRMLTVTAHCLLNADNASRQINIFSSFDNNTDDMKISKMEIALDEIRGKFGVDSIVKASFMNPELGIYLNKSDKSKGRN
jgi:DNA polymerase-4